MLLALLPVGVIKWRDDLRRYGGDVMLLSIILVAQGVHTIEHIVQWVQYYVLYLPARQSNGLLSAANAEWVHFIWNWAVLLVVLALMRGGMRNWLGAAAAGVTPAHTLRAYLYVRAPPGGAGELQRLSVYNVTRAGPARHPRPRRLAGAQPVTQGTFLCSLPGLTTAMRLDVHFWWNVIEMGLLLIAGSVFLRGRLAK